MSQYPEIELNYRNMEPPFCWKDIFGNSAPVEIEVGFGKCGFLIHLAAQFPTINFLGIEKSRKYYQKGLKKVQHANLRNVKLLWGEAAHILQRYIKDASVAMLYVNFPDPWPKKKHAKRRLLNADFAAIAARKLVFDGCIEIATDIEAYAHEAMNVFDTCAEYEKLYYRTNGHAEPLRLSRTEYEEDFLRQGKTLHYAKYQKRCGNV
ncbi:tRNA (guanine-N(7)-)-methyltransferase [Candidatus Vecturithrix granuli]|uniref:tRNA (guanine-N(7)-)-methyltransferase n=1 Tax=Vecturithrix granuli TaxID=1499967 RepID=A0A081C5E6_VECG1|nr:tRNA (guanine-N(7)-)-methyltransferase [Candidatus Vecturithrix granuli]